MTTVKLRNAVWIEPIVEGGVQPGSKLHITTRFVGLPNCCHCRIAGSVPEAPALLPDLYQINQQFININITTGLTVCDGYTTSAQHQ